MASQQKRPSISNWFSSLRRQPKHKKSSSSLYGGEKQFQRSCIDLSTGTTFYVNADIKKLSPHLPIEYTCTTSGATTGNSTHNLLEEDDRNGLVTGKGKRMSQLCAQCCCNVLTQSRPESPPLPKLSTEPVKVRPRSPSISPFTSVATYSIPALAPGAAYSKPASPTITTLSSQMVTATDVSRDVNISRLPSDEPNTAIFNKRSEFKRTTTTTTTRTLIISRPVELLLNERGEVVARRSQFEKALRSNSLDCVLDDRNEEDHDADSCSSYSPRPAAVTAISGEGGGEFRFIDDSSTSQSENERHSHSNGNSIRSSDHPPQRNTAQIYAYNNNNSELCDVCQNVIQRNHNNTARSPPVIMRNKQIKDELCEVVSEMETLDVPEDCKHSNKDKQMSIGRKKFNMDPKKGIEYLVENRLLRHDPQDVAHFLYKGEGLNKTAIGDYLGEKNDFNEDVLKSFVALHDFTNLILVQALRQFLWSFRLPGEAQKIDRMMETFAQRYCQLNPDIFTNTDTCYVLSFAIIMLNTSLHNPSVKDKPTVEQFISMNRGINNGGDLPRGLLESLYESIRTEPFKIPQDDGNDLMHTFFNPDKEGWLWKQGGRYKSWKRRWFILNDNCLYYFEYTTDKEPRGIIPLENIAVREIHDRSKPHCFELYATGGDIIKACKTDSEGKVVEGKHSVYRMSAATEEDQQEWMKRLTQSISHNPFYDILVQRKKNALSKS